MNVKLAGARVGAIAQAYEASGEDPMTSSFKQTTTAAVVSNGFTFGVYLWSTPANWIGPVPTNGAAVTVNVAGGGNPSGYDDISGLFLDGLTLTSGFIAVGGAADQSHGASLEIG